MAFLRWTLLKTQKGQRNTGGWRSPSAPNCTNTVVTCKHVLGKGSAISCHPREDGNHTYHWRSRESCWTPVSNFSIFEISNPGDIVSRQAHAQRCEFEKDLPFLVPSVIFVCFPSACTLLVAWSGVRSARTRGPQKSKAKKAKQA